MPEESASPRTSDLRITLARRTPPSCPVCQGPTVERARPDPEPGGPSFWVRKKFWFDCAACGRSWEGCGICHRGALVEGRLWGDPDLRTLRCRGGCGWAVAWREKQTG
jgi:hypothetical protein